VKAIKKAGIKPAFLYFFVLSSILVPRTSIPFPLTSDPLPPGERKIKVGGNPRQLQFCTDLEPRDLADPVGQYIDRRLLEWKFMKTVPTGLSHLP
jgi:hypothetical protein